MSKCVYCIAMGGMHLGPCQYQLPPTSEIMPLAKYENIVMTNLLKQKDRRIAELEAEVEWLKDQTKAKWKDAYSRICPDMTEEGEG